MTREREPNFDMSQFEAQFGDVVTSMEAREAALDSVGRVWSKIRNSNAGLPISRRFIVSASPNSLIPVAHERVMLVPKPRGSAIASTRVAHIGVPYLSSEADAELRLDPRYAFIELHRGKKGVRSYLLSKDELTRYSRAEDVHVGDTSGLLEYHVRFDTTARKLGSALLDLDHGDTGSESDRTKELETLQKLVAIFESYDPDLQDNLPRS